MLDSHRHGEAYRNRNFLVTLKMKTKFVIFIHHTISEYAINHEIYPLTQSSTLCERASFISRNSTDLSPSNRTGFSL